MHGSETPGMLGEETPGRTPGATPSLRAWEATPSHIPAGSATPGGATPGGVTPSQSKCIYVLHCAELKK